MSNKVPQIRFNGYSDDWEERKLGNLFSVTDTKHATAPTTDKETQFRMIRTSYVRDGRLLVDQTESVTEQTYKEWSERIRLQPGDIVFSREAPIGEVAIIPDNSYHFFLGQRMVALRSTTEVSTDAQFTLATLLAPRFRREVRIRDAASTTVANFGIPDIKKTSIYVPTPTEQNKLGTLIMMISDTIALHQRKLDLLKEQKKGYLQKMFPKNGAKIPELRFAGFADDWEERKLGDHAKYRRGSFPQPYGNKEWYDGEGSMPFVQVVDVTNKLTLVENTKQKISKLAQSKSVFVPKGKVVVTLQGSIGRVAITQYDSFVDRTLLIFEDYEKETDERFWAYTIQKKFEIEKLKAPGGTIKTITKEALSSFDVHLPKFEEQQQIGSFFKQLDDIIALHQRKLDLLKEQKKGFLQKMFV